MPSSPVLFSSTGQNFPNYDTYIYAHALLSLYSPLNPLIFNHFLSKIKIIERKEDSAPIVQPSRDAIVSSWMRILPSLLCPCAQVFMF